MRTKKVRAQGNGRAGAVAKGYRLKPATHKLIAKLQKKINGTKDDAISRACKMLYNNEYGIKKTNIK